MATKKTFSISLDNNASMKPLYGSQYLNVFLQFDPSTSFERMKKATLHVCILNISPTENSFTLYDEGDITNLRDTSLNEVIDSYHSLVFVK